MLLMGYNQSIASSEWIIYDEGEAVHPGSGMPYQGVRFSLPAEAVRAPLLQVAFFYSTNASFCPVRIHLMDHSRSVRLLEPITHNATQGWNYVDLSLHNISVPHNFYVILENSSCGYPMLDDQIAGGRSFKGNYLQSMTTRQKHDLLIRVEIGDQFEIPVAEEWDVSIFEKMTVKQPGVLTEKIVTDSTGKWKLYSEGSFTEDNGIYGILRQKGKKVQILLDAEDVRIHIIESLSGYLKSEITDMIVTKISFTGKESNGYLKGSVKIFARIVLADRSASGKIAIERKFTGISLKLSNTFSSAEY